VVDSLVMEFMPEGDLGNFIKVHRANNRLPSEKGWACMLLSLVLTMLRLWDERKLLHLDLKPDNLLLEYKGADTEIPVLKVGAFPVIYIVCIPIPWW
jgi:serine/threonine protein kinase